MVRANLFFVPSVVRSHSSQDLIFKNQAMNSRKNEGAQFVNDLLRTEFHKYVHMQTVSQWKFTRCYRKFMTKFIKVCVVILVHGPPSNHITSVINILCSFAHVMCIGFHSLHPPIYKINHCPKSILLRPNLASPFGRIRDLWYTSAHVEKCTVYPAWDPDEVEGSILDNIDVRSRPEGVGFRLFLRRP